MKHLIILTALLSSLLLSAEPTHTNRLANERSPYLLQHAHNPVDWYPWSDEAFEKARSEHKLIFLSIGYSTCHWCHVMEKESFEDEAVARLLNESYVSIKVDKEELPHVDKHFQRLHTLLKKRNGGWPLTVIMTEEAQPFFITTYIPKEDGYGVRGLMNQLPSIALRYQADPKRVQSYAASVEAFMQRVNELPPQRDVNLTLAATALSQIKEVYDPDHPGFSLEPKFPESSRIALLLDIHALTGEADALAMAEATLRTMAKSGMYDQVEGAFYRYAVNQNWQIPHFEKMLYTNAELIPLYVRLHNMSGDPLYAKTVRETIGELNRRFREKTLFFSASDADSDGVEGGYFMFTHAPQQRRLVEAGFSPDEANTTLAYLGITPEGNFDSVISNPHITSDTVPPRLGEALALLKDERSRRTYPFIDKKSITSWNAMMATALLSAGSLDERYTRQGLELLTAIETELSDGKKLFHQNIGSGSPEQPALLEDYAFLINAYIEAHAATLDTGYLKKASRLADRAMKKFFIEGRWYLAHEGFNTPGDLNDRYYTSPLSMMLHSLIKLGVLTETPEYYYLAKNSLESFSALLAEAPGDMPEATRAMLRLLKGDVVLKSSKENLEAFTGSGQAINHPYLHLKIEATHQYLACGATGCFANGKALQPVIEAIEALR
jgi:uncharacterized protein YyaL (SSP411 family)